MQYFNSSQELRLYFCNLCILTLVDERFFISYLFKLLRGCDLALAQVCYLLLQLGNLAAKFRIKRLVSCLLFLKHSDVRREIFGQIIVLGRYKSNNLLADLVIIELYLRFNLRIELGR